jgi:hypothetical protein
LIVVVGTTNGQGPGFGAETDQGKDWDGFLAKISPADGQLINEPGFASSYRIQSKNNKHGNDWVSGICHNPNDEQKHIYIAGTTEGKMLNSTDSVKGTSAFLMKFDVRHMQPIWTKQLGAEVASRKHKNAVRGTACAVTPDGSSVWFGGTVDEGGVIPNSGITKSFGGKDIFVAKLSTATGEIGMTKQLGTSKDDELALRGGLVSDAVGNAVLVGNTYGSLYRIRAPEETSSDVFVMTVGIFDGATSPLAVVTSKSASNAGWIILWLLFLTAIVILATFFVYRRRRRSKRNTETPRSDITTYLAGFDIEDVELKHSATGGWHCNFVNKLARGNFVPRRTSSGSRPGVIAQKSNEIIEALRRGSPTVEAEHEMLFGNADPMDESNRSTNSLLFGGEQGSVYSDLVEAYNNTWDSTSSNKRNSKGRRSNGDSKNLNDNLSPSWGKEII